MPTGTIKIVTARWDQIEAGDTIIDYAWRYPRWVTVTQIRLYDGGVEVWIDGAEATESGGLMRGRASVVDVQIVTPTEM